MDEHIAQLYKAAPRFDEGETFQSQEYNETVGRQEHIRELLIATFGEGVAALLEDYAGTFYDEMELEARHFFQEGYRAASADAARS